MVVVLHPRDHRGGLAATIRNPLAAINQVNTDLAASGKRCYLMAMLSLIKKFRGAQRESQPDRAGDKEAVPNIQGYVDERATTHVTGWMRNLDDPQQRLTFEIAIVSPDETRVIGRGLANLPDPALQKLAVGDGLYGFRVDFAHPLTADERDHLIVRSAGLETFLELAPQFQGFIDERSIHHIAGWIRSRSDPQERVAFEVVLPEPDRERILASGRAAEYSPTLAQLGIGDATYGFRVIFAEALSEAERDSVFVRAVGTSTPLDHAPALRSVFEPVSHVAMDIVNNCNLRCPFCVYDYSTTRSTRVMAEATFESALRLIPFVTDGNFWLSCEHEATMHPELIGFIERIPRKWRRKVMYTTNLARPMPEHYFSMLAESGLHHLNVSLESLDPTIYEQMRKGARWRIFAKNWDQLIDAMRLGSSPPRLRYIIMAYQSNFREIPGLIRHLLNERLGSQIEVRHTFDVAHMPADFRATEFLGKADWDWLGEQLASYAEDQLLLIPPPKPDAPASQLKGGTDTDALPRFVTRPLNLRLQWDGRLIVYGEWTGLTGMREHEQFVVTNIHHLRDPRQFLISL